MKSSDVVGWSLTTNSAIRAYVHRECGGIINSTHGAVLRLYPCPYCKARRPEWHAATRLEREAFERRDKP